MKEKKDVWHFPRTKLAEHVLSMFDIGLSHALVFFAPRRMGKTEFLRKDIEPLAKSQNWEILYFSFLDVEKNAEEEFLIALSRFADSIGVESNMKKLIDSIKGVSGEVGGLKGKIELFDRDKIKLGIKELLGRISAKKRILFLMDEVQVLAKHASNEPFIAGLRTALDMYKDNIKVIFTGSSREGLRKMFSQSKAPFFHFGQNVPFPPLGKEFTDHLAVVANKISKEKINPTELWNLFQELQMVPQLIRSLLERFLLNPGYTLREIKEQLASDLSFDRGFSERWEGFSALDRLLLIRIASGNGLIFAKETREEFASKLGIDVLANSTIQSSVRTLLKKGIISRIPDETGYLIEDPNFRTWIQQN